MKKTYQTISKLQIECFPPFLSWGWVWLVLWDLTPSLYTRVQWRLDQYLSWSCTLQLAPRLTGNYGAKFKIKSKPTSFFIQKMIIYNLLYNYICDIFHVNNLFLLSWDYNFIAGVVLILLMIVWWHDWFKDVFNICQWTGRQTKLYHFHNSSNG